MPCVAEAGFMRESALERMLVETTRAGGGRAFKLISPGSAGIADRLLLLPVPAEHQQIVQRYVKLVEVKAPGQKLRPLQQWFRRDVESVGHCYVMVDSATSVRELFR